MIDKFCRVTLLVAALLPPPAALAADMPVGGGCGGNADRCCEQPGSCGRAREYLGRDSGYGYGWGGSGYYIPPYGWRGSLAGPCWRWWYGRWIWAC